MRALFLCPEEIPFLFFATFTEVKELAPWRSTSRGRRGLGKEFVTIIRFYSNESLLAGTEGPLPPSEPSQVLIPLTQVEPVSFQGRQRWHNNTAVAAAAAAALRCPASGGGNPRSSYSTAEPNKNSPTHVKQKRFIAACHHETFTYKEKVLTDTNQMPKLFHPNPFSFTWSGGKTPTRRVSLRECVLVFFDWHALTKATQRVWRDYGCYSRAQNDIHLHAGARKHLSAFKV